MPDTPRVSDKPGEFIRNVAHNIRAASLALFHRPPPPGYFKTSLGQLFVFCLMLWAMSAIDDLLTAGFNASLSIWGVIGNAALNYFWLAAVGIVAMLLRDPRYFLPLAIGTAAVSVAMSIFFIPADLLWQKLSPLSYQAHIVKFWWFILGLEVFAFFRIVTWYCPLAVRQRFSLAIVYGGVIFLSIWYFPPQSLFSIPWESPSGHVINVEDTYYAQDNLMRQALFEIPEETAGQVDIYSIGVAAFGDQNVFYREVDSALDILDEQFGKRSKSLALINNPQTVNTTPLASMNNLRHAVNDIAKKMNLDEDVFLLFLSSHGSEDGRISVEFDNFALNDISSEHVRRTLDEANIYWRIIIVSACYSGSFIDALQSPTTLIITAAAADKASFGCDNVRDWTYFGEAFFSQALRANNTFVSSFDAAKKIVKQRETEESKEASDPQLWLGEAMKAYLTLHAL